MAKKKLKVYLIDMIYDRAWVYARSKKEARKLISDMTLIASEEIKTKSTIVKVNTIPHVLVAFNKEEGNNLPTFKAVPTPPEFPKDR